MEISHSADPFAAENSGTARFVGAADASHCLDNGGGVAVSSTNTNAANAVAHDYQTIKPGVGQKLAQQSQPGRTEIPHSELVKMLYYLEGELQARDVVIAALRNERVKQYITQLRSKRVQPNDPYAAIFRDKIALTGNLISRESSTQATQAEMEVRQIIEQQMEQQYQMVNKQRATHLRMVNILTESLENNQRMLQELEEEKRKHEHDTAQGDDITYGLELERTKLRQELDEERVQVKKMEKDMKKLQETLDYERNRQKQIVLLLIAERKKILMKYIEEGKRSEDLAQILAEEKQRSDTIAEGLEEESKKSLRMEEELEKQAAAFDNERKTCKMSLAKEEAHAKELEQELAMLRSENEALKRQQLLHQQQQQQQNVTGAVASNTGSISTSGVVGKARQALNDETCVAAPMVNIAKIVQPTATVSSVPVSGPTTGIARSIAPGQNIRSGGVVTGVATGVAVPPIIAIPSSTTIQQQLQQQQQQQSMVTTANNLCDLTGAAAAIVVGQTPTTTTTSLITAATAVGNATTSIAAAAGTATGTAPLSPLPSTSQQQAASLMKMQPTATIQRAPGGKYSALAAAAAAAAAAAGGSHSIDQAPPPSPHPVPIAVPPVTVPPAGARGAPPPIPPNKPIVPPKREPSLSRLGSITAATVSAAAAISSGVGAAAAAGSTTAASTNANVK